MPGPYTLASTDPDLCIQAGSCHFLSPNRAQDKASIAALTRQILSMLDGSILSGWALTANQVPAKWRRLEGAGILLRCSVYLPGVL
jgi:hypothetical protein